MPPPPPSGFKFHTVDESEVAARLIECVAQGPRGRVADFGGPDVPPLEVMAAAWTEAGGIMKTVVRLPVPGAAAAAFRTGANTAPGGEAGSLRWREWLAQNAGKAPKITGTRLPNISHNSRGQTDC